MAGKQKAVARPEPDGDTEQRILDAARRVFVRRGTAGARMQEIAEEAGVNQALLHYYFRSKDRLAATVFREAAGRLIPMVAALLGSDAPLADKVERFVHLYIDVVRRSPFLPGYVAAELHHHPERLTGIFESVQATGELGPLALQRLGAQLEAAAAAGEIRRIAPAQFLVNLFGLVAIPFLMRPLMRAAIGMDDAAFGRFLDERRAELPRFVMQGLRP